MWADYVIKKIFGFRGENLRNYFDDLELELVIPKLIQYIKGKVDCENVTWIVADEFFRLSSSVDTLEALEDEQLLNRQIRVQSLVPISDAELLAHTLRFSKESTMPQACETESGSALLVPIMCVKKHEALAYLILTGVPTASVQKTIQRVAKDISKMAKHIGFSIQHWNAQKITFLDDLTGLYNQKYMSLVLENEIHRSQRENAKFTVLFMDVDFFKTVNDTRGHWIGSRLLIEVGHIVKSCVRRSDYAFRYGGDEFVIVLPNTPSDKAVVAAERIRSAIEKQEFIIDGETIKLTLSIGLAAYPDHAKTYKDIIKMADEAMYCGKNKSRNIVFVAS
ncbi:MAG: GGDEF domain-containing protein [Bdellovibrionales bacterium]|nr:GGDEF domain-containing protein [Bdellovibrionales bacterium]